MIEGPRAGWRSPEILGLFVVSAAALGAFVYWERRNADPMMDLKLFRDRTYSLAILTIFAVLFAVYGMLLVITQYLQNVRGYSPTEAGLLLIAVQRHGYARVAPGGTTDGKGRLAPAHPGGARLQITGFGVMIAGMRNQHRHRRRRPRDGFRSAAPCA